MKAMKGMILGIFLGVFLLGTCSSSGGNDATSGNNTGSIKDTGTSLFSLFKSVQATPAGNLLEGAFVRIGYVPGRDRIIVTFNTKLNQPEGGCVGQAYAYKEYTTDMVATANAGVISCHAFVDTGGLFVGDDFYLASMELQNGYEGWLLAKYDAVTWTSLASLFHPLHPPLQNPPAPSDYPIKDPGDPMVAYVNGQIDISSTYRDDPTVIWTPFTSAATFHDFFTTDLQFVNERILSETPHINLSSMITVDGTINFLTGTAILGDLIVMQYDLSWNYLGTKTLKQKSACSEGVAFDGKRFYVSYLDVSCSDAPCYTNVRLAAFDTNWNLLDDIAVTSGSFPPEGGSPARPTLILWNNRLYVAYDDTPNHDGIAQAFVKVYDVSSTVSITKIKPKTAKAGSKVTVFGKGFSTVAKRDAAYFDTKKAKISKATTSTLNVTIPKGLKGAVGVHVVVNGQTSNSWPFIVK